MQCSFCDNPAAHPATGCVYGPRTIACWSCTVLFWRGWLIPHVNKKPSKRHRVRKGVDFYKAAGKWKGLGEP